MLEQTERVITPNVISTGSHSEATLRMHITTGNSSPAQQEQTGSGVSHNESAKQIEAEEQTPTYNICHNFKQKFEETYNSEDSAHIENQNIRNSVYALAAEYEPIFTKQFGLTYDIAFFSNSMALYTMEKYQNTQLAALLVENAFMQFNEIMVKADTNGIYISDEPIYATNYINYLDTLIKQNIQSNPPSKEIIDWVLQRKQKVAHAIECLHEFSLHHQSKNEINYAKHFSDAKQTAENTYLYISHHENLKKNDKRLTEKNEDTTPFADEINHEIRELKEGREIDLQNSLEQSLDFNQAGVNLFSKNAFPQAVTAFEKAIQLHNNLEQKNTNWLNSTIILVGNWITSLKEYASQPTKSNDTFNQQLRFCVEREKELMQMRTLLDTVTDSLGPVEKKSLKAQIETIKQQIAFVEKYNKRRFKLGPDDDIVVEKVFTEFNHMKSYAKDLMKLPLKAISLVGAFTYEIFLNPEIENR